MIRWLVAIALCGVTELAYASEGGIDLLPNKTLFSQWAQFLVAIGLLHFGIFRPTLRLLKARRARTEGAQQETAALQDQNTGLTERLEAELQKARAAGNRERAEQIRAGEGEANRQLESVRAEITRRLETTRGELEGELKKAELSLRQVTQELARQTAERLLERKL